MFYLLKELYTPVYCTSALLPVLLYCVLLKCSIMISCSMTVTMATHVEIG